jgi:hypothetical protein
MVGFFWDLFCKTNPIAAMQYQDTLPFVGGPFFALLQKNRQACRFRLASFDVTVEPGIPATGGQAPQR